MPVSERDRAAEWLRRFADNEGAESPRYQDWARGLAADDVLLAKITRLPLKKRQPALLLACARLAGVPLRPFSQCRDDFITLWPAISRIARKRSVQTNEPRRSAPLVVALNKIRRSIALIEVGAAAGLTLIPDRYSYRLTAPGRVIAANPRSGASSVTISAAIDGWGADELRLPDVVYREGIDLAPLDLNRPEDVTWLETLVWPEQTDRLNLIRAAITEAANVDNVMTAGDALAEIRGAVARARKAVPKATIVVWSPAVLVYLDPADRAAFQKYCRTARVTWVSLDGRHVLPGLDAAATKAGIETDFVLTRDGEPIAGVDPLGRHITMPASKGLSATDIDMIEFERLHWGSVRGKESLVRQCWDLSLVRYYQRLYAIMEGAAARRYDPVLASTFAEVRQQRVARRSGE